MSTDTDTNTDIKKTKENSIMCIEEALIMIDRGSATRQITNNVHKECLEKVGQILKTNKNINAG